MAKPVKQKDLKELKEFVVFKLRKLKSRVLEYESTMEDLSNVVKKEVKIIMDLKIKRMVLKSVSEATEDIVEVVLRKVSNGYLEFINRIAEHQAKIVISKGIHWEIISIKESKCGTKNIFEMYDKGYHICFYGKLASEENIFLFERPTMHKKSEKKKVKRNPA